MDTTYTVEMELGRTVKHSLESIEYKRSSSSGSGEIEVDISIVVDSVSDASFLTYVLESFLIQIHPDNYPQLR